MAIKFRKSDSMEYIITKWFNQILETNKEYLDDFSDIIKISHDDILDLASELHKNLGKGRPKNIHETRSYLLRAIAKMDLKIVVLKETAIQYKILLEEINDLEIELTSLNQLVKLIVNDLESLAELQYILKNLVKATNLAFKTTKKPSKISEENFDDYYKTYSRLIKSLKNESEEIIEQFNNILLELEKEVENAKTIKEEKVPE
jgi:hypothetical protein